MIKKLRRTFIIVAMSAVVVVISIIMLAINLINYYSVASLSDNVIDLLVENGGRFPLERPDHFSPETPYETRYFSTQFDYGEKLLWINSGNIIAIKREEAILMSREIIESGQKSGYKGIYRFRLTEVDDGYLVIFVDCEKQLATANNFLFFSIIISLIGTWCVFVIVFVASKWVIKPMSISYEKQKQFITNSNHELKTPLSVISANNDVLELEYGQNEWTESIRKAVDRLTELTSSLTALARMDERGKDISKNVFSISDSLYDIVKQFEIRALNENRHLDFEMPQDITYLGNESMIRQLFSILMDNAIKYSKSEICVRMFKNKGHIVLEVSNDVEKIEEGFHNEYFDRFYRADESRTGDSGFGIGLSIAKAIIDSHNGKATIKSVDGVSIMFQIIF